MIFLVDTMAFSGLLREHPRMDSHMAALGPTDRVVICSVVICSIVRGEIRR